MRSEPGNSSWEAATWGQVSARNKPEDKPILKHIRGPRLLTASQLTSKLHRWPFYFGHLRLGNVWIPPRMEFEHMLILGSQGSGKSSLVRSILQQIEKRKQIAVIIDPECEFVQEFYRPERGDYILNPLDERAPFWSPWLEFRDEQKAMDVQAMAASLVRGRASRPEQAYWQTISRRLLEKLFHQTTNLQTLQGLLELDKSDARTGAMNAIWPLSLLQTEHPEARRWSAVSWSSKRDGWLFLTSTEDSRPAIQALQGIWLDLLIRRLMSNEIGAAQTWIVADEVATMGYQPQLEQSLITRGRKRGLSVILSLQNIAQLRAIYGHDPTITLASQPGTMVLFKCREPETAQWASDLIGKHEVSDGKINRLENLVLASEIQTLPKFHAYIINGEHRAPLVVNKRFLKTRHAGFIFGQRPEVSYPQPKPVLTKEQKSTWRGLQQRCNSPAHASYRWYGAKGVELRFKTAEELFAELGPKPDEVEDWTIDRVGPSIHYEPGNLKWATKAQQTANRKMGGPLASQAKGTGSQEQGRAPGQ